MTALASRYLDRLKEKSSFESPNRELTKLTKVPITPACASDCAVEKNAQQGPDTELTKLTKPQNGTLVSLVSSPNGHSKSHFSSETPANETPAAAPAPLATASYGELVAWMDSTGETDAQTRREILVSYGFDPDFQYPDSGRRTCRQCANLDADGGCRAARRGQIPNTSRFYTYPPGIDAPHRCVGYLPGPDDPDKRPGRERFDWPTAETQPDTGKAVCARCAHWTPDRINPSGGLGRCTIAAPASKRPGSLWPWPDAEIHCTRFQETNS
ncbi:hypothetical protein HW932_00225 [Allochromatium humboldtianum]|uniref:Uncharacterized protein n=1 Tax=Allochromatium humboldtianum TaxID=504901 RepID=A0A850REV9_9GAMM|nr:hypothetical protein [Allochromatium humboldtianum]NVZ07683.1 hypothetical protein [Allochromatium humboldtianum]